MFKFIQKSLSKKWENRNFGKLFIIKKRYLTLIVIFITVFVCILEYNRHIAEVNVFFRFDENDIIGHNRREIVQKYGEFDEELLREYEYENGKKAVYTGLYEVEKIYDWGPSTYKYYFIYFDRNNIAVYTVVDYMPGG